MDIEAIVRKYAGDIRLFGDVMRAALTELAAGYEERITELQAMAINNGQQAVLLGERVGSLQERIRQLSETHAIEMRAYEATVANQAERIRQLEAERVPDGIVNLPATDHRITVDDEGVPTIMLGCGGFVISDVYSVGLDYAGVSLELRAETKDVGMSDFTNYGKSSGESGAVLKIVATRPESLLVLIGELQEAVAGFGTLPPAAQAKEGSRHD